MSEIKLFRRANLPRTLIKFKPLAGNNSAAIATVNSSGIPSEPVATAAALMTEKEKTVPQPCTSCGRSDLPERLHTHISVESNCGSPSPQVESSKIPIRLDS